MGHGASVVESDIKKFANSVLHGAEGLVHSGEEFVKASEGNIQYFQANLAHKPLQDPTPGIMLLGMKCVWLSELAYHLEVSDPANVKQQALMMKNLQVDNALG